jgi:8-oxo-dGTP diphosphatase
MTKPVRPGEDFPGIGVGLIVRRGDGKVLVCKRLRAPEAGHWSIVGGKIDMMELAGESARREANEETGLTIGRVDLIGVVEAILENENQHWVSLIYLTDDFDGEPRLTEPDKHADWQWIDIDHPPQPLSLFAKQAFEHLQGK